MPADEFITAHGRNPFPPAAYDFSLLPDGSNDFVDEDAIQEFVKALAVPDQVQSPTSPDDEDGTPSTPRKEFITALNDWRPIYQRVRRESAIKPVSRRRKKRKPTRGKDETREGYVYTILKWPLLLVVMCWIIVLAVSYATTRIYIFAYEHFVTMRGRREKLRQSMQAATSYEEWLAAAKQMDKYLGNDKWRDTDDYAYYNSSTIRRVRDELRRLRHGLEAGGRTSKANASSYKLVDEMRVLIEAAAKDNFVGVENPRLYSETYYGTKNLIQDFIEEVENCLRTLSDTQLLSPQEKANMFAHLSHNFGRTAFCLSGGATFAYYHFGVAKALLDADILPEIITGTSGGALVAALLGTRTNAELKQLLVPALANRITACEEPFTTWFRRWYKTGARFDSVSWARKCGWFCRGSITFREAYELTGRVLNVTCIPSDPHSPTILANYLTAPDCVVWSAVLASAAVPGILNPVVLMKKTRDGRFEPYSFGHKWKDGSLRTDIPLRTLNTHFNVNFSIVSQVNPHINLFFFSSRGTVGRPVTHRRGRGWRGGFLGSATEQYLKLDLYKWLKVLRHLELLPRFVGQDWSEIWLQRFSGTITIWPKSVPSDFVNILSDPDVRRLARMIHVGQQVTWPKILFCRNRDRVEKLIERGRGKYPSAEVPVTPLRDGVQPELRSLFSEEDLEGLLAEKRRAGKSGRSATSKLPQDGYFATGDAERERRRRKLPRTPRAHLNGTDEGDNHSNDAPKTARGEGFGDRLSRWWSPSTATNGASDAGEGAGAADARRAARQSLAVPVQALERAPSHRRRSSFMQELGRQSRVFFDDTDPEMEATGSEASAVDDADLGRAEEVGA